jgi:hypothetical protein
LTTSGNTTYNWAGYTLAAARSRQSRERSLCPYQGHRRRAATS